MSLKFPLALKSEGTNSKKSDEALILDALQLARHGWYPFARNHCWHGGIHITQDMGGVLEIGKPVHSIGKGEIVAFRLQENDKPKKDQNSPFPYSTGFVLVKHAYELPAEKDKKPEKVDYFSLYMHTQSWSYYKGETEYPTFLDVSTVNAYKVKDKINLSAYKAGQKSKPVNLFKTMQTDISIPKADKENPIRGLNVRSGTTGKTVTGIPEGTIIYAVPLNSLSESERPEKYKKTDPNRALIRRVETSTLPPWYNPDAIPKDGIIYIKDEIEVEEIKSERQPKDTPKIAKVDKHERQTGFAFDTVIACNPAIPVDHKHALGYLGQWKKEQILHFEIFCGGTGEAEIIEKARKAATKVKQKNKNLIPKGTTLYNYYKESKGFSVSKRGVTKGIAYSGANAIKHVKTKGNYEQWQLLGEYQKIETTNYKVNPDTDQPMFWLEKGLPKEKKYGRSKTKDADYFTKQTIEGWDQYPHQVNPNPQHKTLGYDLYTKTSNDTVEDEHGHRYQKHTLQPNDCDSATILETYIKNDDIQSYSAYEWKNFQSIMETNPASIGTSAKENLVQDKAEALGVVPALGNIATKDDDLSPFAKALLTKLDLQTQAEKEEQDQEKCLLNSYKKIQFIYQCKDARNKLLRLVCRHPTEWYITPKKSQILKLNEQQDTQRQAMGWWDEAEKKGVKGLPQAQMVWHFHPVGFLGNFANTNCDCIDYEKIYANKGFSYRASSIVKWSHYNKPISSNKEVKGNSRIWGDISKDHQKKVINELIRQGKSFGFTKKKICLLLAIARTESGFNPDAAAGTTSAAGIGQFIDRTAKSYNVESIDDRFDVTKGVTALIKHCIDNEKLAIRRGQDPLIWVYKYHHDGPTKDYGGLTIVKKKITPLRELFERSICDLMEFCDE